MHYGKQDSMPNVADKTDTDGAREEVFTGAYVQMHLLTVKAHRRSQI